MSYRDTVASLRELAKSRPVIGPPSETFDWVYTLANTAAHDISTLLEEVDNLNRALKENQSLAMAMTRQVNARVDRENDVLRIERKSVVALAEKTEQYINGKRFPERDGVYGAEERLNEILLLLRHRLETTPAE